MKGEPIILESSTKDVEVDIGDDFDLDCLAQGYPWPNISWIRADSRPLQGGLARYNVLTTFTFVVVVTHSNFLLVF